MAMVDLPTGFPGAIGGLGDGFPGRSGGPSDGFFEGLGDGKFSGCGLLLQHHRLKAVAAAYAPNIYVSNNM
jgi:hypothetical protein